MSLHDLYIPEDVSSVLNIRKAPKAPSSKPRRHRHGPEHLTYATEGDRAVIGVLVPSAATDKGKPITAWLWAEDYEAVREAYGSRAWTFYKTGTDAMASFVRIKPRTKELPRTLARFIAKAPKGTFVRYRDNNPLNLRRSNLDVIKLAPLKKAVATKGKTA